MPSSKITIVTVVLNDSKGIKKTFKSLSSINKSKYEHVVIDGKSTDGTFDFLKKKSERIDILISENDSGIYDAMNKGVKVSNGDIICFLNAGDTVIEGYLDYPLRLFKEFTNIDYCYGGVILKGRKNTLKYIPNFFSDNSEYLQAMPFPHPGLFVRKNIFEEIGYFDLSIKNTADHEWIIRMIKKKYIGERVNHCLVEFKLDGASLHWGSSFEMYRTAIKYGRGRVKSILFLMLSLLAFLKYIIISRL